MRPPLGYALPEVSWVRRKWPTIAPARGRILLRRWHRSERRRKSRRL